MKGLIKSQLKKVSSALTQSDKPSIDQDQDKKDYNVEAMLLQDDMNNNSSGNESSMIKSRNRSSTLEIIEEVQTRKEKYLKKSIQNLTEREESNDTEENEEDEFSDTYKKYSNSAPEKDLKFNEKQENNSEGCESQDSCNESQSTPQSERKYQIKKSPIFKKRMSIIDECLDQIRKRRDLIAAKLISNTYELDEELLDSSDLSEQDSIKDESKSFNLSQQFNSGNQNQQFSSNNKNNNNNNSNSKQDDNKQIIINIEETEKSPKQLQQFDQQQQQQQQQSDEVIEQNSLQITLSASKLSDNAPLISIEKLDSIINPIKPIPSPQSLSPIKKNASNTKLSQQQPSNNIKQSQMQSNNNNIKQSTIKQSQYMGMSRNFGGGGGLGASKRFDIRKSSMYQNIGGLSQSRMMNATTNNLKQSSQFCFEGFQDRQFARQMQKVQEEEEKSLVRQFENFIDQIKKEKEQYVQKIKSKRDNTKDFFKAKNLLQQQQQQQQQLNKSPTKEQNNNTNSLQKLLSKIKNADGDEKTDFSQSINLMDEKQNNTNTVDKYNINFEEYEDLNVYQLLERIEEEFLSKKQMDPQMSQYLRESMMMSIGGGGTILGFGNGDMMEKTFFPLVITDQDHKNFEMKKIIDELSDKLKYKNLIKLEQILEKQKKDLKDLEIEHIKVSINYQLFQQNEQLKEDMKREQIQKKKKKKVMNKLQQSPNTKLSNNNNQMKSIESDDEQSDLDESSEDNEILESSILKSQSFLNCTIAMNNENFEKKQKDVTEIFNNLLNEYNQIKELNQKNNIIFQNQHQELDQKLQFLKNMNSNMDQTLEFNLKIKELSKNNDNKNNTIISKQQQQQSQDKQNNNDNNEIDIILNEIKQLQNEIEYKMNQSDLEFQYKKKKKIIKLLQFKNKLNKLQFQKEFQTLLINIDYNTDELMENKQILQDLLSDLRNNFEELKEYNILYKDEIIDNQLYEIDNLKIEIENNLLIERDLKQKLDISTQVLYNINNQYNILNNNNNNNNNHSNSFNNNNYYYINTNDYNSISENLEKQKYSLINQIKRTQYLNSQVNNQIHLIKPEINLQYNQQYMNNE